MLFLPGRRWVSYIRSSYEKKRLKYLTDWSVSNKEKSLWRSVSYLISKFAINLSSVCFSSSIWKPVLLRNIFLSWFIVSVNIPWNCETINAKNVNAKKHFLVIHLAKLLNRLIKSVLKIGRFLRCYCWEINLTHSQNLYNIPFKYLL